MCELYAVSSVDKVSLNEELDEFFSHSETSPDGWGLAYFNPSVSILKEEKKAVSSSLLKDFLKKDVKENLLIAHIRRASRGALSYLNTHPFVLYDKSGREWTLVHNGTIFTSVLDMYKDRQTGSTDSERILAGLVDFVSSKGSLSDEERIIAVGQYVKNITALNKVNLVIYDGTYMYYHTNLINTLYFRKEKGRITISTKPLRNGKWENVPLNTLIACRNGENVFYTKRHDNLFTEEMGKNEFNFSFINR